jgi:hypothetical protein
VELLVLPVHEIRERDIIALIPRPVADQIHKGGWTEESARKPIQVCHGRNLMGCETEYVDFAVCDHKIASVT